MATPPGGSTLPFTKAFTGYDLARSEGIEAAADAGLVVLINVGVVFMGTVTGS